MSPDVQHGTISGYKYRGCRCDRCRTASVRYEKGRRYLIHCGFAPTLPAHGFNRRVHALMALGWTQKEIAAQLGIAQGNLAVKLRTNETVRRATHEAMCEVYERLCMTVRHTMVARRTARIAERRGWPPPLAWDDIDDPDAIPTGIPTPTRKEAAELTVADWELLQRNGYTRRAAAEYMGISRAALEKAIQRTSRRMAEAS